MKKQQWIILSSLLGSVIFILIGIKSQSELIKLRQQNEDLKQKLAERSSDMDLFSRNPSNTSHFSFGAGNDPFEDMRERMDQFFNDSFFDHGFADTWKADVPSVEVEDLKGKYLVVVRPFDPERYEVETKIEGQYLKLNISSKNDSTEESKDDSGSYQRHFSANSQITKQIYLREQFDPDHMDISINENLLEIEIPKIS